MSALPISITTTDLDRRDWKTVAEMAVLGNCSERTIQLMCQAQKLHAKSVPNENGGRDKLLINLLTAPAAFRRNPEDVAKEVDAVALMSSTQRAKAMDRLRLVEAVDDYVAAHQGQASVRDLILRYLATHAADHPDSTISISAYYRMKACYIEGRGSLLAMADRRLLPGVGKVAAEFTEEAWQFFVRIYGKQNGLKATVCYGMLLERAQQQGWKIPHKRTVMRRWKALHRSTKTRLREGPTADQDLNHQYINRDYSALASNEMWNADHHEFDVLVKVGERLDTSSGEVRPVLRRPWLTAWQDLRSRKIVGSLIRADDPNTDAILIAFRRACISHGIPEEAYTDNGKDFDCKVLTGQTKSMRWEKRRLKIAHDTQKLGGIYAALGIKHTHAQPYHGQSKPIERFFNTLEDRFGRLWPTYCGNSTDNKPEQLPDQLARANAPTLDDFAAAFDEWLESDYHHRLHTGDSMNCTPDQAWQANLQKKRTAPVELLDLLLQPRIGPVKVGRNGVCNRGLWYGQYDLASHMGEEVYLRISQDLGQVSVWTAEDRFLCQAKSNRKLPPNASQQQLREALREKRAAIRSMRAVPEARLRITEDLPDAMLRAAATIAQRQRECAGPSDPTPPTIAPVRSDIEAQLPAIRSGMEVPLKKAVGDDTPSPRFQYSSTQVEESYAGTAAGFIYHGRSAQEDS